MSTIIEQATHVLDMDEHTYHADPVPAGSLSASMAKVLIKPGGPAKLRHQLDNGPQTKRVFDFGHAAHQLILGKGAPIAVIPANLLASNGAASTNAAKAFIDDARNDGATPLKPGEAAQVVAMAEALRNNRDAMEVMGTAGMQHEVSAFAQDEQTGVWLRCRFDMIAPTLVGDYKTAANADPGKFSRTIMLELGYHVQAAHYLDVAAALGLADPDAPFKFVVQEKEAPYLVSVITVGAEYLDLGRRDMRRAINLWAQCTKTDTWPGYPATTATPPRWAIDDLYADLNPDVEAELLALLGGASA